MSQETINILESKSWNRMQGASFVPSGVKAISRNHSSWPLRTIMFAVSFSMCSLMLELIK
jgi:hypothetical protein